MAGQDGIAGEKIRELHLEKVIAETNSRHIEMFSIDPVAERKLLWKIDVRVVPVLWFLFMLTFLDRTNIGNAKIQGLTEDLDIATGNGYNIALFVFFIPYILFEVPSNIIIKKVRPRWWLSGIMVAWGICTVGQGLVRNKDGLYAMRVLIGFFEAGFFPGCIYLISMYYRRYELQWRVTIFFSGSVLASAFSGLLAYAIAHMDGIGGYSGWRWIFIIEGIATVVFAIAASFFIVDWPEKATFLNEEERTLLVARLAMDVGDAKMDHLDKTAAKRAFGDWKIYMGILMYFGIVSTGYATSFFAPTIIKQLGYTTTRAQVLSIPIFIVATCLSLLSAWLTDRLKHRYAFCMIGICLATIGYVLLLCQTSIPAGARYMAIYFVVGGGYICQPITLAWINNNMAGHYKRSISSAMMVGFGNCGGLVASNVFITKEAPGFVTGYSTCLALVWLCAVACTLLLIGLRRENKKRERGERDWRLDSRDRDNLGDDHPHFRFTY